MAEADARLEGNENRRVSPVETNPAPLDIGQPTRNRPHCKILLLDGEYFTIPVPKKAKGEMVINELFRHLELKDLQEREYFSVYYVDSTDTSKIFLNPYKQIRRQIPNASSRTTWELCFGVQFYATELSMLADEMTRYLFVLQICRDIQEKRLYADHATKLQLTSLLVQANCGDYDQSQHHTSGYVEPYIDMIYNSAEIPVGLSNSVVEAHKEKTGFKPSDADNAFFMIAKVLYKFGQQIFVVRDRLGQSGQIGASITGLFFHKDGKQFMHVEWKDVVTVGFRRKKLRIKYHPKGDDPDAQEWLYLKCSEPNSKLVWRGCVEQHTFFRLEKPTPLVESTSRSFYSFNRNSELRFSHGKTLYQMQRSKRKSDPGFQRSLSLRLAERNKDDDVFLPARGSQRNKTIHDKEPEPIGLPDRQSQRNATIRNNEPEPIGLPHRSSERNETLYVKEPAVISPLPETFSPPDDESKQVETTDGTHVLKDETDSREQSLEPDSLQHRIEEALKQRSEEHDATEKRSDDKTDTNVLVTVEINQMDDETKSDTEEVGKYAITVEPDIQQSKAADLLPVEIEKPDSDGAHVEFSSADKLNSSFMVMLEETTPSPEPTDAIMLEGKYRSNSIIPTDVGPDVQYMLEKAKEDGTVTAAAVNIDVHTPTPNYDETKAEIIENELNKVSHVETSSGDGIEVAVSIDTSHSNFVDM